MKKKFKICLTICIMLLFCIFHINYVFANEGNKKEYNLEKVGMKIKINNEFTEKISMMLEDNNTYKKDKYVSLYNHLGILADFVDSIEEKPNKEIIVIAKTNSKYQKMPDLKLFPEEELNKFKQQFVEGLKKQGQENNIKIENDEIIKTPNYNCFIKIKCKAKIEDNNMNINMYYTIVNGRLLTISFRNYNDLNHLKEEQEIIENIKFYEIERPNIISVQDRVNIVAGITVMLFIILIIVIIIIRIKDRRIFNKSIKDRIIKRYSKFGGILSGLWILNFFQIMLGIIKVLSIIESNNFEFYNILILIQEMFIFIISIYLIYIMLKRKQSTPQKIININVYMLLLNVIISIIEIIYLMILKKQIYIKKEISIIASNFIYSLMWITYYKFSKRVQVYYNLKPQTYKEIIKETKIYKLIKNKRGKKHEKKN